MLLKLQFFWELTEGGSPPSFSRAFSSTWQGLSALPHTRIGQILASLANSCLGASICPMRVWLTSCRFALALSQTFNVCWEYGQICACVSPYFPTFPDISCPPKESFSKYFPQIQTKILRKWLKLKFRKYLHSVFTVYCTQLLLNSAIWVLSKFCNSKRT